MAFGVTIKKPKQWFPTYGGNSWGGYDQTRPTNTPYYTNGGAQLNFPVGTAPAFTGGAPGLGGPAGSLTDQYKAAYDKAVAANEARYQEGKKGYADLHARSMGYIKNMGQQQLADARLGFKQDAARARQGLINSGTASGSLLAGAEIGARRRLGSEERRINDDIQSRNLATDINVTNAGLGFLERRNDLLPDMSLLAQLAKGQAAAQQPALMGGAFGWGGQRGGGNSGRGGFNQSRRDFSGHTFAGVSPYAQWLSARLTAQRAGQPKKGAFAGPRQFFDQFGAASGAASGAAGAVGGYVGGLAAQSPPVPCT